LLLRCLNANEASSLKNWQPIGVGAQSSGKSPRTNAVKRARVQRSHHDHRD